MIFLDSDAVIAFLRGRPEMASFFAEYKNSIFAISVPVVYELYYGFYFPPLSKKFKNDKNFLEKLKKVNIKIRVYNPLVGYSLCPTDISFVCAAFLSILLGIRI